MNKEAINNQETNYSGKNKFIRNGIFNKRLISILAFIICSLVFLLIVLKLLLNISLFMFQKEIRSLIILTLKKWLSTMNLFLLEK